MSRSTKANTLVPFFLFIPKIKTIPVNLKCQRIIGNWMVSFLSPLAGGGITFSLPIEPEWLKIVLTALVASFIVTGIVIGNTLGNAKK